MNINELESIAMQVRRDVLGMVHSSRASHVGSCLSCVDILVSLYFQLAVVYPTEPKNPNRDVIVLSKGHAAAALYSTLARRGFLSVDSLEKYCTDNQPLGGHVTSGLIPGVEFSTGSLGHGLPYGVGVALSQQMRYSNRRTFVVISDGECNEGSVWEAALQAAHFQLNNLCVLIDRNGLQSLTTTEETIRLEPLESKWQSFGWRACTVSGHSFEELQKAIEQDRDEKKPTVVICETIKGKGISFMENSVEWHYKAPNDTELAHALQELLVES